MTDPKFNTGMGNFINSFQGGFSKSTFKTIQSNVTNFFQSMQFGFSSLNKESTQFFGDINKKGQESVSRIESNKRSFSNLSNQIFIARNRLKELWLQLKDTNKESKQTNLHEKLDKMKDSLTNLSENWQKFAHGAVVGTTVYAAQQVDEKLLNLRRQLRMTGEEWENLTKTSRKVATNLAASTEEMLEIVGYLKKYDVPTEKLERMMQEIYKLHEITGIEQETLSKLGVTVEQVYGMNFKEYADKLAYLKGESRVTAQELANLTEEMSGTVKVMRDMGASTDQVNNALYSAQAAYAFLAKQNGVNAQEVTSQLKEFMLQSLQMGSEAQYGMSRIISEGGQAGKMLGESLADAIKSQDMGRVLESIIKIMQDPRLKEMALQQSEMFSEMFGGLDSAVFKAVINSDIAELNRLRKGMEDASKMGMLDSEYESLSGFTRNLDKLKNQIGNFAAAFGEPLVKLANKLLPPVIKGFEILTNLFVAVNNWSGGGLSYIVTLIAGLVAYNVKVAMLRRVMNLLGIETKTVTSVFTGFWKITKLAFSQLASAVGGITKITGLTKVWTAVQAAWNIVMTANPIGVVIAGIGLLVAAGYALYKNWDSLCEMGKNLFNQLTETFGFEWLTFDFLKDKINGFFDWLGKSIFGDQFDNIKETFNNFVAAINSPFEAMFEGLENLFKGLKDIILTPIKWIFKQIPNTFLSKSLVEWKKQLLGTTQEPSSAGGAGGAGITGGAGGVGEAGLSSTASMGIGTGRKENWGSIEGTGANFNEVTSIAPSPTAKTPLSSIGSTNTKTSTTTSTTADIFDIGSSSKTPASSIKGNVPATEGLGGLSAKYESAKAGSKAVGWDSTGLGSYGKYQIATGTGTMDEYLKFIKDKNPEAYQRLSAKKGDMTSKTGAFAQEWKALAEEGKLGTSEHDFIKATHYDPAFSKLSPELQKMVEKNPALQDVLWSTSVQHGSGGASSVWSKAQAQLAKSGQPLTEENLIKAVYAERGTRFGKSSAAVQASVQKRFAQEQADALAMLERTKNQPVAEPNNKTLASVGVDPTIINQPPSVNVNQEEVAKRLDKIYGLGEKFYDSYEPGKQSVSSATYYSQQRDPLADRRDMMELAATSGVS